MYVDPIFFAKITDSDKGIKLPWIGSTKDSLYKTHGFHTGIDLYTNNVYSYASGVVTSIGRDDRYVAVTIQYDIFTSLRYLHLNSATVVVGQIVQSGFNIGTADKYVHFEYATKNKGSSLWAVRVGTETYYKQNPDELQNISAVSSEANNTASIDTFTTKEMVAEFWNGKG